MIHARSDYNRIQDPAVNDPTLLSVGSSPIGEDEPVFLVRAKDQAFTQTLAAWCQAHIDGGGDPAMSDAVRSHMDRAIKWRERNYVKLADAPHECLMMAKPG